MCAFFQFRSDLVALWTFCRRFSIKARKAHPTESEKLSKWFDLVLISTWKHFAKLLHGLRSSWKWFTSPLLCLELQEESPTEVSEKNIQSTMTDCCFLRLSALRNKLGCGCFLHLRDFHWMRNDYRNLWGSSNAHQAICSNLIFFVEGPRESSILSGFMHFPSLQCDFANMRSNRRCNLLQ